jgi:hypothetical protein
MEHHKKQTKLKIEQKKLASTISNHQHQSEQVDETISAIGSHLLFDKVKLTDIVKVLNVKTVRTALDWCRRKGLVVMKIGREKYVNLIDFQLQIDKPFLDHLKAKYPSNWAELYQAYKTLDYGAIATHSISSCLKPKFTVKGNAANDFMNKMNLKMKGNG